MPDSYKTYLEEELRYWDEQVARCREKLDSLDGFGQSSQLDFPISDSHQAYLNQELHFLEEKLARCRERLSSFTADQECPNRVLSNA